MCWSSPSDYQGHATVTVSLYVGPDVPSGQHDLNLVATSGDVIETMVLTVSAA